MATEMSGASEHGAGRTDGGIARFWRAYGAHRYAILFYTLLFTLAVMPMASALGRSATVMEALLGVSLVAAVLPHGTHRSRRYLLVGLVLLLVARAIASETREERLTDTTLALWAIVGLLAAAGALRFVLKGGRITSEHIYAALSAYLLAGIFFGMTYWGLELVMPGSFGGPSDFNRESAIYFSFVTQATLGYGDFLPKTDMMRGLVVFQVIGGQLFLAVMIARLVGLSGSDRSE